MRFQTILGILFLMSNSALGQKCVKGDIEYSMATYSEELFIDKKHSVFLDSLLTGPVSEYFCNTNIKNLPAKDKDKDKPKDLVPSESHVVEPLFINMSTFNGVYAKRVWELDPKARRAVRFRCGYFHQVFIISNDRYYELSNDTIKNKKMIIKLLGADFSNNEVLSMTEYFKKRIICEHFTFLPSFYIKKDDKVLFDSEKAKKSN